MKTYNVTLNTGLTTINVGTFDTMTEAFASAKQAAGANAVALKAEGYYGYEGAAGQSWIQRVTPVNSDANVGDVILSPGDRARKVLGVCSDAILVEAMGQPARITYARLSEMGTIYVGQAS